MTSLLRVEITDFSFLFRTLLWYIDSPSLPFPVGNLFEEAERCRTLSDTPQCSFPKQTVRACGLTAWLPAAGVWLQLVVKPAGYEATVSRWTPGLHFVRLPYYVKRSVTFPHLRPSALPLCSESSAHQETSQFQPPVTSFISEAAVRDLA